MRNPSNGIIRVCTHHRTTRAPIACATSSAASPSPSPPPPSTAYPRLLLQWLEENGATQENVTIQSVIREGVEVDVTVANRPLVPGDLALRIPESLIVTLDRVFEGDGPLSELLTANKLSELAVLTLYLMYEKKKRKESFFYPLIKELDRLGGRGPQGAKSPLLWDEGQAEALLAGSPTVGMIKERLRGIRKEYEELDTVYYMSGNLFRSYPFEVPSEQFSVDQFIQAFAAIQSSIVHLQGVTLTKRFALVPMGPPLLPYSSTSKALLQYNAEQKTVELRVEREYAAGESVVTWCGPQPNSRLLINYGVVDEGNPYDKLPLAVIIPSDDPLYRKKRSRLAEHDLSTQQTFQLSVNNFLPPTILPYLRLTFATSEDELWKVQFDVKGSGGAAPVSPANEAKVLATLSAHLQRRLSEYKTTVEEDAAIIADPTTGPRQTVASKLLRIEKKILQGALAQVMRQPGAAEAIASGAAVGSAGVKFV